MRTRARLALLGCALLLLLPACSRVEREPLSRAWSDSATPVVTDVASPKGRAVAEAAVRQVGKTTSYDAAYVEIDYPGGDVPFETGVCTDVVVRALRDVGVDLQVEVHKDMTKAFDAYPRIWALTEPDTNIDHRRVPNLQVFFKRKGKELPITENGQDYQPGDIVTWKAWGKPHTGVVSRQVAQNGSRFLIVHNIGAGAVLEDALFEFEITGHYRYFE